MKSMWIGLLSLAITSQAAAETETPFDFVSSYLTDIATIEDYRQRAEYNQKTNPADMASCVHDMEAWRLEIDGAAGALGEMRLPKNNPSVQAPQLISEGLAAKARSVNDLGNLCAAFMGPPRDNVNYDALAAQGPKIRAQLEAADKALFAGAALAFATMISMKPDVNGHVSYLVITKVQRDALLKQIDRDFAGSSEHRTAGYPADIAKLFRDKLAEYHMADDRPR